MYTNADTLTNKMNELSLLAKNTNPHIIIVTEALPKHSTYAVQSCELRLEGYELYRNSEENDIRGVVIYVKEGLHATRNEELSNHHFKEGLWINVRITNNDKLLIGSLYSSPNSDHDNNKYRS